MSVSFNFTNNSNIPTSNIIEAAAFLPLSVVYIDSNNSLIHYSSINGQLIGEIDSNFIQSSLTISNALSNILNSTINASNALPFNLSNYDLGYYRVYPTFGSLVVGSYAHYLFGSANYSYLFKNRSDIISSFNGNTPSTYQIPTLLASTIINLPSSVCTNIVNQTINQDSSRYISSSSWSALEFKTNDVVYFTLSLGISSVESESTVQQYIPAASNYPGISYYIAAKLT